MKTSDLIAFREKNMGNNFLNSDGNCNEMELNNFSALDASIQQQFTPDSDEESSSVLGMFGGFQTIIQKQKEAQALAAKAAADEAAKVAAAAVTAAAIAANQPSQILVKSVNAAQTSDTVIPTIQNTVSDNSTTVVNPVPSSLIKIAPKPPVQSTEKLSRENETKKVSTTSTESTSTESTSTNASEKRYMGMSKNTGLIVLGVVALGVGAFVYFKYIKK